MSDPVFTITLADLKVLADAMCAVDTIKVVGDRRQFDQVKAGHDAIVRTLGPHVELVYAIDDGSGKAAA